MNDSEWSFSTGHSDGLCGGRLCGRLSPCLWWVPSCMSLWRVSRVTGLTFHPPRCSPPLALRSYICHLPLHSPGLCLGPHSSRLRRVGCSSFLCVSSSRLQLMLDSPRWASVGVSVPTRHGRRQQATGRGGLIPHFLFYSCGCNHSYSIRL